MYFISTEDKNSAVAYSERKRPIVPPNYVYSRRVKRKKVIANPVLNVKMERIHNLQDLVGDFNQRLIRGEPCDSIDLLAEDIAAYQELYNSDNDDDDEGDNEEEHNQDEGADSPDYCESDEQFSGQFRFFTDVRNYLFVSFYLFKI